MPLDPAVQYHDDRARASGRPRWLLRRLARARRCPGDRAMPGLQRIGGELLGDEEQLGGWRALLGLAVGVERVDAVTVRLRVKVIAFGPAQRGGDLLRVAGYRQYGHRRCAPLGRSQRAAEPGVFEDPVEASDLTRTGDGIRSEDGAARRGVSRVPPSGVRVGLLARVPPRYRAPACWLDPPALSTQQGPVAPACAAPPRVILGRRAGASRAAGHTDPRP